MGVQFLGLNQNPSADSMEGLIQRGMIYIGTLKSTEASRCLSQL